MTQGALGAIPLQPAGTVPNGTPTGNIPVGIQQFIVQAILGQGVTPPPTTLVNQS